MGDGGGAHPRHLRGSGGQAAQGYGSGAGPPSQSRRISRASSRASACWCRRRPPRRGTARRSRRCPRPGRRRWPGRRRRPRRRTASAEPTQRRVGGLGVQHPADARQVADSGAPRHGDALLRAVVVDLERDVDPARAAGGTSASCSATQQGLAVAERLGELGVPGRRSATGVEPATITRRRVELRSVEQCGRGHDSTLGRSGPPICHRGAGLRPPAQGRRRGRAASDRSRMCRARARSYPRGVDLPAFVLRMKRRWVANGLPDYPIWIAAVIDSARPATAVVAVAPARTATTWLPAVALLLVALVPWGARALGPGGDLAGRSSVLTGGAIATLMTRLPGGLRLRAVPARPACPGTSPRAPGCGAALR